MVDWWFGLVVWIPRIPLWKGMLLRGITRIPNHQPKPPINHSWLSLVTHNQQLYDSDAFLENDAARTCAWPFWDTRSDGTRREPEVISEGASSETPDDLICLLTFFIVENERFHYPKWKLVQNPFDGHYSFQRDFLLIFWLVFFKESILAAAFCGYFWGFILCANDTPDTSFVPHVREYEISSPIMRLFKLRVKFSHCQPHWFGNIFLKVQQLQKLRDCIVFMTNLYRKRSHLRTVIVSNL